MSYFDGIQWIMADRLPRCEAWLPHWSSDYYALNFARSGRIRWAAGRHRSVTLTAPVAWWTWPGQTFSFGRAPGESWDHSYVTFRGDRVRAWVEGGLLSTDTGKAWVSIRDARVFSERMDELVHCYRDPVRRKDWMVSLLESLLALCTGGQRIDSRTLHAESMEALARAMNQAPGDVPVWENAAREMGMSLVHFRRTFRAHTGMAPNRYLIHARMRTAADRLRGTRDPIKQIAADLGYDNIYYFTKLFKDRFGLPPGRYREASGLMTD